MQKKAHKIQHPCIIFKSYVNSRKNLNLVKDIYKNILRANLKLDNSWMLSSKIGGKYKAICSHNFFLTSLSSNRYNKMKKEKARD